ncbi:MAG: DNA replication and repair protein RecF, partial [Saprospiraceae bacterium]
MHLQKLILTNFKNYEFQTLEFSPRLNLITGLNGMGKTNLLDAVYFLCMGKSRSSTDRNVLRRGADFFRLEGWFFRNGKKEKIVAKVVPGNQKTLERNDNLYPRIGDHVGWLPVVFKAPDDTGLAMDGSEERRRFLDNTLCQLRQQYLQQLMAYNKVLQMRNAALKQFAEKHNFNEALLTTYDQHLLEPAAFILEQRTNFITRFEPLFQKYYRLICSEKETADCCYRSQLTGQDYATLLKQTLEKDRVLQRTTAGIHKDDLAFQLDELPLKRFASQGQLKSFVLSLKLAQYECLKQEKDVRPILLLDDLFDKLDDERVNQLIQLLVKQEFGQVFITDTHLERTEEIARKFNG